MRSFRCGTEFWHPTRGGCLGRSWTCPDRCRPARVPARWRLSHGRVPRVSYEGAPFEPESFAHLQCSSAVVCKSYSAVTKSEKIAQEPENGLFAGLLGAPSSARVERARSRALRTCGTCGRCRWEGAGPHSRLPELPAHPRRSRQDRIRRSRDRLAVWSRLHRSRAAITPLRPSMATVEALSLQA